MKKDIDMKKNMIRKVSNGELIDLSKLNKKALMRLHYGEEKILAQRIRELPPFSKARFELTSKMYHFSHSVMPWYLPEAEISFGANENSVGVVCDFLRADNKEKLVYEAGVGSGFSCQKFAKIPNVTVKGCDVILSEEVKALAERYKNFTVEEDTFYNSLKRLTDNSIDIFYADNVIEHLLPDEFPKTLRLLYRKMKRNGVLFLIIPNRLIGPCDVSLNFLKKGDKAEGSHFMEMSYRETLAKFKKAGFLPKYYTWRNGDKIRYGHDYFGVMNRIKTGIETILYFFIKHMGYDGEKAFYKYAMTYYILVKTK